MDAYKTTTMTSLSHLLVEPLEGATTNQTPAVEDEAPLEKAARNRNTALLPLPSRMGFDESRYRRSTTRDPFVMLDPSVTSPAKNVLLSMDPLRVSLVFANTSMSRRSMGSLEEPATSEADEIVAPRPPTSKKTFLIQEISGHIAVRDAIIALDPLATAFLSLPTIKADNSTRKDSHRATRLRDMDQHVRLQEKQNDIDAVTAQLPLSSQGVDVVIEDSVDAAATSPTKSGKTKKWKERLARKRESNVILEDEEEKKEDCQVGSDYETQSRGGGKSQHGKKGQQLSTTTASSADETTPPAVDEYIAVGVGTQPKAQEQEMIVPSESGKTPNTNQSDQYNTDSPNSTLSPKSKTQKWKNRLKNKSLQRASSKDFHETKDGRISLTGSESFDIELYDESCTSEVLSFDDDHLVNSCTPKLAPSTDAITYMHLLEQEVRACGSNDSENISSLLNASEHELRTCTSYQIDDEPPLDEHIPNGDAHQIDDMGGVNEVTTISTSETPPQPVQVPTHVFPCFDILVREIFSLGSNDTSETPLLETSKSPDSNRVGVSPSKITEPETLELVSDAQDETPTESPDQTSRLSAKATSISPSKAQKWKERLATRRSRQNSCVADAILLNDENSTTTKEEKTNLQSDGNEPTIPVTRTECYSGRQTENESGPSTTKPVGDNSVGTTDGDHSSAGDVLQNPTTGRNKPLFSEVQSEDDGTAPYRGATCVSDNASSPSQTKSDQTANSKVELNAPPTPIWCCIVD